MSEQLSIAIKILRLHLQKLIETKKGIFEAARRLSYYANNLQLPEDVVKSLHLIADELFLIWFKLDVNATWAVDVVLCILDKLNRCDIRD